ncbi:VWA domain-containing protein [Amycolatopsis rifamycinica]|uniref:Translocation protein TolB n=1 Tax=Amycolatopsis rifamycinica TaxID=287986 RepID=A0A066TYV6_9PSEU|nr:VWA domain-containing protein [Amycolatopsis rifamycinica]KDN18757.1 translocation protein TolB [Amycolatopsis rifamycinica]
MRANRAVAGVAVVAVLGGWAISGALAPTEAQAPAPVAAPYRVGYVSEATTGLYQATGEGAEPALPRGTGSVDADASAGTGGLVWVSHRAAAGGAEWDGELCYLPDGASVVRKLTDDDAVDLHPALSPDGRTVAFASERAGGRKLFVIGVDGRGLRQVTSGPATDDSPSWSPDGTRLAFSSTRDDPAGDIYTVPVAGGTPARLTADPAADTQPAWGPARIAFTTTRFHPAGDVVLVAETGGAVTRAVPDPGDSSEPAWSSDGARLAFTTRAQDPFGDVKQIDGGRVSVISALRDTGETEPAFRPDGRPVFTELRAGGTTDIWSADATGGDRRDLTHRPGAGEYDPAFSADGSQLAYTQAGPGESSSETEIVVANADGGAPRALTGPRDGSKREQHPAWSPDATMIAFTNTVSAGEGSQDTVRVARAADGRVLGDIPLPPHLRGEDSQPVWSADGTKITLTRAASRVAPPPPGRVRPSVVDVPVGQGSSVAIDKTVPTDKVPARPDIVLLMDQTGSMGTALKDMQTNLTQVMGTLSTAQPEAWYAAVAFGDRDDPADENNPNGRLFQVQQDLTKNQAEVTKAFEKITVGGGIDTPEDWIHALDRIATGAVTFRPDSSRIIVLAGDAPSHDPSGVPGHPDQGVTLAQAIEHLKAQGIRVVAVSAGSGGGGLDAAGQATEVVNATGGVVASTDPGNLSAVITEKIGDLGVKVLPTPFCDPGLTLTFDPGGPQQVPGGTEARFTEFAAVAATAPLGAVLHCRVEFRIDGENFVRPGYTEDVTVRVRDPRLPLITVPDTTVTGTAPTVIEYSATAIDADRETPLTPFCTPSSGSLFPVGATTVTCTATGRGGTATETAVMSVDPGGEFRQELWQVSVESGPDRVVTGTQRDLSPSFGTPCGSGRQGSADVSPDGAALVFHNDRRQLCVAPADGGPARILVQDTGNVDDPAWSPDGSLVAFDSAPTESRPSVRAVPAAGGAPSVLIDGPGGAAQPAFRRIADVGVTATAVPAAIPFSGLTTFEFVVTNHGVAASPGVGLFVRLTAGLRPQAPITSVGTCTPELVCAFGTLAPGAQARVRFSATGAEPGAQAATGTVTTAGQDADARDNSATAAVTVGAKPLPPVTPGSLSVGLAVSAVPLFTGGDDVVLTFLVHNGSGAPMPDVRLVTQLPPQLPATSVPPGCAPGGGSCALGTLAPGQTVEVRISLAASAAADAPVSGTVSTSGPDTSPGDNTAGARVVIRRPVVTVDPGVGPLGSVPRVTGTDFPPGATVRLAWSAGISETPGLATVGVDGKFEAQFLIFHHDLIGPRTVAVTSVSGPKFGAAQSNPILVVLRTEQPPFISRG